MNDQDKTKSELIKELQQLREDNNKFRKSYGKDITDRKQSVDALRESEARFRNLFQEVQSVSVQGYGTDGTTKYWNLASEQLYGYTAQEAIGQNLLDLIIPSEMREDVAHAMKNMAETGQPIPSSELSLMRKDGSRVSVFSSHTLISIPGHPQELFCIDIDLTERKQAEEALKKSQLLLKSSIESQRNTILFSIDQEYKYLYFNKAHSDAMKFAYNTDISLGMNILDCITSGADRKAAKENYDRALKGETHSNIRIYGDIELAHYESFFNPIFNENNEIIGATGLARNISSRKQAEDAILNSKQKKDNLVSKIPVGVYILKTKPEGTFALEYVSPRMAEMLDLSVESLLTDKETIFKAIHPDDLDGFATLNQEGIYLKRPFDWKGRVIVKGEVRWLHITSLPQQLESGDILWHGLIVDITKQMQNEAEIQLKNEELINLNATKDKFFSIIAHDLRSPFNSFLGLTEIMSEDLPNLTMPQLQEMIAGMNKSATNLYRLLENLLNWSQIQKGTIPFNPEEIQIGLVTGEIIEMIQEQAKNKKIKITTEIPDGLVVFADSNMLQTIIRNLVSNAIKYTNKGGRISLSVKSSSDKNIVIAIQDTGIGMSREMVDNLFRIDTNANRKGTEGEPSTGLGLLLCKEFVEKHGGKIWVESCEGKGSTFYFTFPSHW
ncbi:MAG: PAS domain S-box protein [Bacteroidota bacterium]|nr:PAS domain S-box protein [Bacteroidota bacterium]